MIRLVLPLPPSTNRLYSRSRAGGVYLNPKIRQFRAVVAEIAMVHGVKTIEGRFRAKVTLHPADARKFDGDNREKSLWDALQHAGVIEDDCNNYDCHRVVAEIKRPNGLCIVELYEVR